MKSLKIFALMLIAAAFTACSNDEGNDYIINDATVKVISTQTSIGQQEVKARWLWTRL